MKFFTKKSLTIKTLFILTTIIYILYLTHKNLFSSFPCTYLYNINSFEKCASSNKTCNLTELVNSYLLYRNCVVQYSSNDVDYVVFDAVNGLGNRILGLISVVTYALVTSRVLLINWEPGDNHGTYFEDLFVPLSSSERIPSYHRYTLSRFTNLLKNRWMNEIEWERRGSRIPRDWTFYFDQKMLCDRRNFDQRWFERLGFFLLNLFGEHTKWIRTDQYFVPLLTRNEERKKAFSQIFSNGQIFAELSRRILRPIEKVNLIIEDFQRRNPLRNQSLTIGVHMRSWSSDLINHIEPFEKCINHLLQNITKINIDQSKIYLYVISNTPKRRQLLEERISKTYKSVQILHSPSLSTTADIVEQMQYTLAELMILSQMQHLILSSRSTFGMIAQGLAHQGAWIVRQGTDNELNSIHSDICQWESTSEPEYQIIHSININQTCPKSQRIIGERTII